MFGGSQNYTVHLDDNTYYVIKVKRPQFLISSLHRRKEYLFSLLENRSDIDTMIINNYKVDTFNNTLFALWNIDKIQDFISKLNTLIDTHTNHGVNTIRDEMHIIGLQILKNQLSHKRVIYELEMTNERLNNLHLECRKHNKENVPFRLKLPVIVEEGGLLRKKSIRKKSIRNQGKYREIK
jgi:hypothetical protein